MQRMVPHHPKVVVGKFDENTVGQCGDGRGCAICRPCAMQFRVKLSGPHDGGTGLILCRGEESPVITRATGVARPVTRRQRDRFIEKEQLGVLARFGQVAVEVQRADQPARGTGAIAHECAASRRSNHLSARGNAIALRMTASRVIGGRIWCRRARRFTPSRGPSGCRHRISRRCIEGGREVIEQAIPDGYLPLKLEKGLVRPVSASLWTRTKGEVCAQPLHGGQTRCVIDSENAAQTVDGAELVVGIPGSQDDAIAWTQLGDQRPWAGQRRDPGRRVQLVGRGEPPELLLDDCHGHSPFSSPRLQHDFSLTGDTDKSAEIRRQARSRWFHRSVHEGSVV